MALSGSGKVKAFILAVSCCSSVWAGDDGGSKDRGEDGVRATRLPKGVVDRWLAQEFGNTVISGADSPGGLAYSYREGPYTRVVGRMMLTCRDEAAAGKLYRIASTRRNFRTRKILTIYVVQREGKVVSFYYGEGVGRIADGGDECDVKCQFEVLERRHAQGGLEGPDRSNARNQ